MFPLSNGRLIRLNKDGSNGEVIQSNKTKIVFGTSIVYDHHIKDVDPANEVSCEISTDEYGRVSIANKTTNEIFVNDKPLQKIRPLFNNSIIKICDGVEFRWVYKQAKENIGGDLNDADFASWSDPAKMHMKQSRVPKQRPKGRLTAHPINLYSTAHEDIDESDVPSTESDDKRSTGCSVIPTELNDSVFTTQTVDATNVTAPLIDVSQELINLDETQINIPCEKVSEELPTTANKTLVKNEVKMDDDLMNFDVPSEQPTECNASAVKSQPSNCSVITLSSDGSQETITQEINDQNVDLDDEEMFERSISCPPTELPDDLFETSSNEDTENLAPTNNTEGADTTDRTGVNDETFNIKSEVEEKPKAVPRRSSVGIESTQQLSKANTSFEQFSLNEDDVVIPETQDIIIPETQEVLSQDSDVEVLSASCSIIDCEKSEYSFDAKDTVSETVKQNISIGQPNISVVSISSDEGQEVSQVEATNENSVILDSKNMFKTDVSDEHQQNVQVKAEVPISPAKSQEDNAHEDSTYMEESNRFNESETMFSQSLNADVNESITETKPQILDQPELTDTLRDSEETGFQTVEQETVASITANNLQNSTTEPTQPVESEEIDSILMPTNSLAGEVNNEEGLIAIEIESFEKENNTVSTTVLLETSNTEQQETEHVDTEPVSVNEGNFTVNESIAETQTSDLTNVSIHAAKTEEMVKEENSFEEFGSNNDENEGIIPIATSSSISVCLSTDTTQELNLLAFNSEFGPLDEDTMDRLEFSSSDSMHDSNDSGVTGSCANTSSINVSSEANQMGSTSIKSEDVSISEMEVARTPSKENSTKSPATDLGRVETVPSNELEITNIVLDQSPDNISTVEREEKIENVKQTETVNENIDEIFTSIECNEDVATFATPAKIQLANECASFGTETSAVRCTPRDLTVSLVQNTSSKIETKSPSLEVKNEIAAIVEDMVPENSESTSTDLEIKIDQCENSELESTQNNDGILAFSTPAKIIVQSDENCGSVTRSTRRKQPFSNVKITTPKRTPRKFHVNSAMTTPAKVDVPEEQPVQVDIESIPEVNVSVMTEEEEAIERLLETFQSNVDIVSTPAKIESKNIAEQCNSTITRSKRRIPPVFEIATPKHTPRKLNISVATPSKTEIQSSTENHNEDILEEKHIEENVEMVQSIEKVKTIQTDEEALSTPSVEVTVNAEAINDQNEDIITETPEQIDDMTTDNVATFSTPIRSVTKSDESRALTIPRATRRKPLVADIGLVTPKRTPRKMTTQTERPLDEAEFMEKSESPISNELVENKCIAPDQQDDAVFATPAKVPLAANGNSTIKRSARRKQENVDFEIMTPKRTPRKLNASYVPETPCEEETSIVSEQNQSEIADLIPIQSESNEKPNEPIQSHDDIAVLSTPAKVELDTNLDERSSSALTRSARHEQNPVTEWATPKQTLRKLDVSLVAATPIKPEAQSLAESNQTEDMVQSIEKVKPIQTDEEALSTPSVEVTVKADAINDQNEDIITETPEQIGDMTTDSVATCSTPVQNVIKSDDSRALTIPRATRRKPLVADIGLVTPKRTPRKVNISVALTTKTPSTHTEKPFDAHEVEFEEKSESPISNEPVENECIEPDQQLDAAFLTPAKVPLAPKSNSTIKRSARRKQENVDFEVMTPKRTPKKLNASYVPETPCEVETSIVSEQNQSEIVDLIPIQSESNENPNEPIQSHDDIAALSTPAKIELSTNLNESSSSVLTQSIRREQNLDTERATESVTPKQTPRKLDISLATTTPCKMETPEDTQTQESVESMSVENDSIPTDLDKTSEEENFIVEVELPQIQNDIIVLTPVKIESINRFDETSTSSITRSSKRKQNPVIKFATPKRTPRKLDVSRVAATPIKPEEQSLAESNQTEDIPETHIEEKVEMVQSIEKVKPIQTVEEALSTPSVEVTVNAEAIKDQNKDIITETPEQCVATFSTPVQNVIKSDDSRALTIPRATRRKPLVADIGLVTPKRTLRKFNISVALTTATPSTHTEKPFDAQEGECEIKSESPISDEPVENECIEPDQQESAVFATPAKVPLTANGNSTIKRSTRREQENLDSETTTPKRRPRKMNASYIPEIPCEVDTSNVSERNQSVIVNDKQTEENVDLIPVQSESNGEPNEPIQSHDDISILSTPAKVELASNLDESSSSTLTRMQNPVTELATPVQTPRKLDISLAAATPIKPEEQSLAESNQTEDILEEKHIEENVEMVQSIEKEEPIQTDEEALSTPNIEVAMNEDIITETSEQIGDMITDNVATFSTPNRSVTKSDESRALTIPRATRRKPLVVNIGLVTPKRTPRKVNISVALTTETPSTHTEKPFDAHEVEFEEKSESPISNEPVENECIEPDQQLDAAFLTPAKVPLAPKSNSTIKRSARRKQENVDSEIMIPERTPKKLNDSYVPETPCEVETSIVSEQNRSEIVDLIPIQSESNEKSNELKFVIQCPDDIAALSTPAKVELDTNLDESSSSILTRLTRREQNPVIALATKSATPKQTPRKLDISLAMATSCKIETPEGTPLHEGVESMSVENESIPIDQDNTSEETNVQVELPQNDTVDATPIKVDLVTMLGDNSTSSVTRTSRRKKQIESIVATPTQKQLDVSRVPKMPCESKIVASIEKEPTDNETVDENEVQQDSEVSSTLNENRTENIVIETTQSEDIVKVLTPTKPEMVTKFTEEYNSAVVRSSKRKRPDLNIGTPIAKRTPRKVVQDTPLKTETTDDAKGTAEIVHQEPENEPIQENIVEPVPANVESVPVENNPKSVGNKTSDEVYECIDTELAQIHDDAVPAKISASTRSTRNSKATRSTRRKENVDRDAAVQTPNSFNCVVKVTPLKAEVLKAHKSTLTHQKVAKVQVQEETAEKDAVSENANDIIDIVTPSTSKTMPKKRGIRTRTTSKSGPVTEQNKSKDAVSDLVAAVLEENINENAITSSSDVSGKRAGTPLPASKKRTGRLTGPKAKLALESNDKPNQIDAAVDANKKNKETASKTKPEEDDGEVIEKGKSSRRKKLEDVVPKQTAKEKIAAGSSGTPLNKRNRNLAVEPNEEIASSTSEQTKNTTVDESKNVEEKSAKAPVKSTRRKRANTESDPVENTPKKLKTQLDHVNSTAVATPLSLRSLRNRIISTDENSSIATPKRSRQQRKAQNDDKKDDKVECVVPKDKKEDMEKDVPVETEKPKRQPRRRLPRTVSVDEPIGSITETSEEKESVEKTEEPAEDKKSKPAAKRSRAKSKAPADETKSNDDDEVLVKPAAKRGRKNSQAQAKLAVVEAVVEESSKEPAAKKTRRGRPKRVVIAESNETKASAVPEAAAKKRAVRGRTFSKSEENINKASTDEPAKDETKEKVPKKDSTKPRGKRTQKADTEVVEVVEEKQSSPKRSRNTKKAKEIEPEVESIAKETVIEKKTKKTKKVVESKDTEASTNTPPISTRTRRHK